MKNIFSYISFALCIAPFAVHKHKGLEDIVILNTSLKDKHHQLYPKCYKINTLSYLMHVCNQNYNYDDTYDELGSPYHSISIQLYLNPLNASFTTLSGITVHNENGKIALTKNNQTIDLLETLFKYINKVAREEDLINNIKYLRSHHKIDEEDIFLKLLQETMFIMNRIDIQGKGIKVQKNNNSIFHTRAGTHQTVNICRVVLDGLGKEFISWGIAFKGESNRSYYLMTDFKEDISILFDQ